MKPEVTRQRSLELIDIEYEWIRYKVSRIECVDYNTAIERNVMNIDDIEDIVNIYLFQNDFFKQCQQTII